MIPSSFEYRAPSTVEEAVRLVAGDPEGARVLGGGTWLVPELNSGESRARLVVDLRRAGLGAIELAGETVRIGATCTYAQLVASDAVAEHAPVLRRMAEGVTGGRQLWNQGTLGGSLVASRPSSDAPAAVVALGGEAVVAGPAGERRVPVAELFAGPMRSSLGPAEILVGVEVPRSGGHGSAYAKLKHSTSSWPIATAACLVALDGDGRVVHAALALGGVAGTPIRVDLSHALAGEQASEELLSQAATLAVSSLEEPWADVLAPAEYRRAVAQPVARRALAAACADAAARAGKAQA